MYAAARPDAFAPATADCACGPRQYHELFKLAARDAIVTLQQDAWRAIYRRLDEMGNLDGELSVDEVQRGLERMGAQPEAIDDILRALFLKCKVVDADVFVKRASRMRSPLQLDLMDAGDADVPTSADPKAYDRLC